MPDPTLPVPRPTGGYTHDRISQLFTIRNLSPAEREQFLALKAAFEKLAHDVVDLTPSSPHQTIAINKLIEAKDAACLGFITTQVEVPQGCVGVPGDQVGVPSSGNAATPEIDREAFLKP